MIYYLIIPLTWAWMIDKIVGWKRPWLSMGWIGLWLILFLATFGGFQLWCDWAFARSVDFLLWFQCISWDYYAASVYICVAVPVIIYVVLGWLLYRKKHRSTTSR